MPDDATLNDFAADGRAAADDDDVASDDGVDDAADDATADAAASPDSSPDPATATYRWSPDGDACPDCGTAVERRWRDDDRFVCTDCKEW